MNNGDIWNKVRLKVSVTRLLVRPYSRYASVSVMKRHDSTEPLRMSTLYDTSASTETNEAIIS